MSEVEELVEMLTMLANSEGGGAIADGLDEAAATITRLSEALNLTTMLLREMRGTLNDAGQVGPVSVIDNVLAKAAALTQGESSRA